MTEVKQSLRAHTCTSCLGWTSASGLGTGTPSGRVVDTRAPTRPVSAAPSSAVISRKEGGSVGEVGRKVGDDPGGRYPPEGIYRSRLDA
eukprot:52193-Pyramimonas_sp.AAC.1